MAVSEAGSMGAAARRLNTVQPAVSRAIADLERTLGVPLFDRTAKGVAPTQYGRALLECGSTVFSELREVVRTIGTLADPASGQVALTGNEPIIAGLVPTVFARLRRRYNGVSLRVWPGPTTAEQIAALRQRQVDLMLARLGPPLDPDIETEPLYEESSYIVAAAASLLHRRRHLKLGDLIDEPWSLPAPDTHVGAIFAEAFRREGVAYPSRNVAYGLVHLHISLVADGGFLAILPGVFLRHLGRHLKLRVVPVASPVPPSLVGVMTLKGRSKSPTTAFFLECAREVVAEQAQQGSLPLAQAAK